MADRLIRDKILFTVTDKLRQVLLRENPLSLTRAIQLCLSFDTLQAQAKQMQDPNENTVHKVSIHGKPSLRTIKYERHSRSTKYPISFGGVITKWVNYIVQLFENLRKMWRSQSLSSKM